MSAHQDYNPIIALQMLIFQGVGIESPRAMDYLL